VQYAFQVKNTGDVGLSGVYILDPTLVARDQFKIGWLAAGNASMVYADANWAQGTITNTATVFGTYKTIYSSISVRASDVAIYIGEASVTSGPHITLRKQVKDAHGKYVVRWMAFLPLKRVEASIEYFSPTHAVLPEVLLALVVNNSSIWMVCSQVVCKWHRIHLLQDADSEATAPLLPLNMDVSYKFIVRNTGDVKLTNVEIFDAFVHYMPELTIGELDVGKEKIVVIPYLQNRGDRTENVATVSGKYGTSVVTASDVTWYSIGEHVDPDPDPDITLYIYARSSSGAVRVRCEPCAVIYAVML
jgi:hypothetical protein